MVIKQVDENSPVPKYFQIYSALSELITTGEIPAGNALPPTNVLTQRFGVSRITLTKAMDMLEVEGIIERHQGKGTFARDIVPSTPKTIAILNGMSHNTQRFEHPFLWQAILDGAQHTTSDFNFALNLIGPETCQQENGKSGLDALVNHMNGLIFHPGSQANDECIAFVNGAVAQNFPVVLVDRYYEEMMTDRALFNDEEVGYALTQALIDKGHRRIAFALSNETKVSSVRNRLLGYQLALESNGIAFDTALVLDIYSQPSTETHLQLLHQIETNKFSGVVIANDPTTENLLFDLIRLNHDRLKEINLRTGSGQSIDNPLLMEIALEIAMIGDVISPYYRHYISIIARHSGHKLGEAAAKLLVGRINGEITGPPRTVIVPMEIIELE